jgi:amino-acid N-acetyltransferase
MDDAMSYTIGIRAARAKDHATCIALLHQANLPVDDIESGRMTEFMVAESGSAIVGLVGLEHYESSGLLRSLVVSDAARRLGIGARLLAALESRARKLGIRDLWLLTIDADDYFGSKGFTVRQRSDAPKPIARTREFSELCPDSAVLMSKSLDG